MSIVDETHSKTSAKWSCLLNLVYKYIDYFFYCLRSDIFYYLLLLVLLTLMHTLKSDTFYSSTWTLTSLLFHRMLNFSHALVQNVILRLFRFYWISISTAKVKASCHNPAHTIFTQLHLSTFYVFSTSMELLTLAINGISIQPIII